MRLLIITQKVDKKDSILGFFHDWLLEFSKHQEKIIVLCLEKGDYKLPSNVSVFSLGKERSISKIRMLLNFYRLISSKRKDYDKVFVHMNPIYIVLGGLIWKIFLKKDVFLWYTHKSVDWKLRIAEKFSKKIFTASKESFRLKSDKVLVTGHGINTDIFKPDYIKKKHSDLEALFVGRISKTKDLGVCIKALKVLHDLRVPAKLIVLGGLASREDAIYEKEMRDLVSKKGLDNVVDFIGPVSNKESVKYFQEADILVHASNTGSLDKVVLESMACGTPVVSSNDAAIPIVSKFNSNSVFKKGDYKELAEKLEYFYRLKNDMHYLQEQVRSEVVLKHDLSNLISILANEIR